VGKPKIKHADPFEYVEPGTMQIQPSTHGLHMELAHCGAYLQQEEALATVIRLYAVGKAMWGDHFTTPIRTYIEQEG